MKELAKFQKRYVFLKAGETRLSLGYTYFSHPWKLLKLYPSVHSYLFFSSHSIVTENTEQLEGVLSAHGGSLRYEGISQIPKNDMLFWKGRT